MVNSESLSDIFKSEDIGKHMCDSLSTIPSVNDNSSDSSKHSEVKVCDSTKNNSAIDDSSDCKLVTREDSEDSLSWYLHLSEDLSSEKQHPEGISGKLEKHSSDETYISLNTPTLSFEDNKDNIFEVNFDKELCPNPPEKFAKSQGIVGTKETKLNKKIVIKINEKERHRNCVNSSEAFLEEQSSESSSQIRRTSSDSDSCSEISSIPEEELNSHDFQCSQGSVHDSPEPRVTTDAQDCPLECRERQEEWDSQELTRVSERLALRRKQARRLILTVIRKRQMAEETLDAFKKRLKKF